MVAHTLDDAQEFFERKLRYAYRELPEEIRNHPQFKLVSDSRRKLQFANNSFIYVGTSLRGGTYNLLHVSEYGALCARTPKKAEEVASGALNTVHIGNYVFIESTAEGAYGDFYERSKKAQLLAKQVEAGRYDFSPIDYMFHFFPWYADPSYTLNYHREITSNYETYFDMLEKEQGIELTENQKNWYIHTANDQGDAMKKEFPSYPEEAFSQSIEGAIFSRYIDKLQFGIEITDLPKYEGVPINTFWDLGTEDPTAIWFHQRVGAWDNFINYYQNVDQNLNHYVNVLKTMRDTEGYNFGTCYLPHDGASKSIIGVSGTAEDILRSNGFNVEIVPRVLTKKVSIDAAREALSHCRFDANRCKLGLDCLRNYRWEVDKKSGMYKEKPARTYATDGADAFQVFAQHLLDRGDYAFQHFSAKDFDPAAFTTNRLTRHSALNRANQGGEGYIL